MNERRLYSQAIPPVGCSRCLIFYGDGKRLRFWPWFSWRNNCNASTTLVFGDFRDTKSSDWHRNMFRVNTIKKHRHAVRAEPMTFCSAIWWSLWGQPVDHTTATTWPIRKSEVFSLLDHATPRERRKLEFLALPSRRVSSKFRASACVYFTRPTIAKIRDYSQSINVQAVGPLKWIFRTVRFGEGCQSSFFFLIYFFFIDAPQSVTLQYNT